MKKAQVSIAYLGILSLISIFIFSATFVWSNRLKDQTAIEFNAQHAENLLTLFEQRLARMKTVAEPQSGTSSDATIHVQVPEEIGDEKYFVRGENNDLVILIPGKGFTKMRQTIFRKRIYWWNTNFGGGAFSGNGEIVFAYNSTSKNITIS